MAYLGTDDGAIYRFSRRGPGSTSSIRTQPRPSGPSSAMVARMRVSSSRNPMASVIGRDHGWLGSRCSQRAVIRCIMPDTLHPHLCRLRFREAHDHGRTG